MNVTAQVRLSTPVPLGLLAAVGAAAALIATYWDDSWHTDKGRDAFAIPPHLLLYAGVTIASLAVAAWAVLAWRAAGGGLAGARRVLRDPALLLAGLGGAATLGSAPVDAAWHEAYGRDAVLWSPPHLTAVIGTLALAVGLLAGLRHARGRGAGTARLLAAAGVLGALQVPVLEYDSDVPQFSTLWFLPVATLGLCLAVALLDDLLPGRWAPAQAALFYTAVRIVTVGLLGALGFSLTSVPPVLPLLALSAALASLPLARRLLVLGLVSPFVWWVALRLQAEVATTVPASQLVPAAVLGGGAGLLVAVVHGDVRLPRPGRLAAAGAVLLLAFSLTGAPQRAWAHDPGQGEEVQIGSLSVDRSVAPLTLSLSLADCEGIRPVRTVARRAGDVVTGTLSADDRRNCVFEGQIAGLGDGRWFVYAEMAGPGGRSLESWLPARPGQITSEQRPLYAPPLQAPSQTWQNVSGAGLLLVVVGLLVGCLRLARRARVRQGSHL